MATRYFKLSGKPAGTLIAAGIDVHKYKLAIFVLGRFGREYKPLGEQAFANTAIGRAELCHYLSSFYPDDIVMEKTGKLSDSLVNALSKYQGWKAEAPRVSVVPPDTIKRFKGETHTDPNSAFQLARLGLSGLINPMCVSTIEGQRLKVITRESERYTMQSTAIINTIKDTLAGLGYTLPDFSLTSTWGLAFLRLLLGDGIVVRGVAYCAWRTCLPSFTNVQTWTSPKSFHQGARRPYNRHSRASEREDYSGFKYIRGKE